MAGGQTVNVRVGRRTGSRVGRRSQASRTEAWVESAGPLGRVGREEGSWRRLRACPFHQGHQQTRRSGPSGGRGMDRLRDQCCGNSNGGSALCFKKWEGQHRSGRNLCSSRTSGGRSILMYLAQTS